MHVPVQGPQGAPADTHPGEADAADSPTQHVREHGRVRAGRGEVGEEVRAVPVGHLYGTRRSLGAREAGPGGRGPRAPGLPWSTKSLRTTLL